jgi:hypothetical protein
MIDTSNFSITDNTRARLYEIAFTEIIAKLNEIVGNEKTDYFLEHFCKMYEIDFTSISIVKNMYAKRMRPNKREIALFSIITRTPMKQLKIDYRTLMKYRREWVLNGNPQLFPNVVNEFLKPAIQKLVDSYLELMYDSLFYLKNIRSVNNG